MITAFCGKQKFLDGEASRLGVAGAILPAFRPAKLLSLDANWPNWPKRRARGEGEDEDDLARLRREVRWEPSAESVCVDAAEEV
mmetsp:Transcript_13093/g.24101  ORF Transcript_13093/g.24101 Transcript_13093/m.24101 type:complete len:84 (+) Transcript_13093:721-972(+)